MYLPKTLLKCNICLFRSTKKRSHQTNYKQHEKRTLRKNTIKTIGISTFVPPRGGPKTTPADPNHPRASPGSPLHPKKTLCFRCLIAPPRRAPGTSQNPPWNPREPQGIPGNFRGPPRDPPDKPTSRKDIKVEFLIALRSPPGEILEGL